MKGSFDNKEFEIAADPKSFSTKTNFSGNIGKDKLNMEVKNKSLINNVRVYKGTYKGKTFYLEYGREGFNNKMLIGKYGKENIEIVRDVDMFGHDDIESKKVSDDFAPVSAIILGIEVGREIQAEKNRRRDETIDKLFK